MMYRMLTALLVGATMATPVAAQERGPDDDRRGRIDGRRDDRSGGDRARPDEHRDPAPERWDVGSRSRDEGPDARFDDRRDRADDRRNDRYREDRYREDARIDWRGNRVSNNQGDHRWTGRVGDWNRDWREDRRYDWQAYRRGNDGAFRAPRYHGPRGVDHGYRRWSPGYRIAPAYYGQGYWIARPDRYRLPPAYGGYRWVRYYDDVALVDIRSGLIADILYSFFL